MLYGQLPTVKLEDGTELLGVPTSVPNPPKKAVLGLPTNEQLIARLDKQKSRRRSLGNRSSKSEYEPNLDADLDLFNAIRVDKGEAFDKWEASNAIGKLLSTEVVDSENQGSNYSITLKTIFGQVSHVVSIPFQKDLQEYRRSVVSSVDRAHGVEDIFIRITPAVELYAKIVKSIDGYAPTITPADVPANHKQAVVTELIQLMDEAEQTLDPNF